jgi:hypothetical protein
MQPIAYAPADFFVSPLITALSRIFKSRTNIIFDFRYRERASSYSHRYIGDLIRWQATQVHIKAFLLTHQRMIMCGTGMGGFLGKWFIEVNNRMVVRDIDNLDYYTPQKLRSFWKNFAKEYSLSEGQTTSVYHFGFSEEDGSIHHMPIDPQMILLQNPCHMSLV